VKKYKALFLDFDGTLVDSESLLFDAYRQLLASFAKPASQQEFQGYIGPSLYEISNLIKKRHSLDLDVDQIYQRYIQFVELSYDTVLLMPGAQDFLDYVVAKGFRLYVVSSAPLSIVRRVLHRFGVLGCFEDFFTCESVEKMKPDPSIYIHAMEETRLSVQDVLCFEDSVAGVKSALGAGLKVIYLNKDFDKVIEIPKSENLRLYSSFLEILDNDVASSILGEE
tara:strand:+ start:44275 stop:44946 length:672 start_codon:yes stop_codon:yes gene_type:complete